MHGKTQFGPLKHLRFKLVFLNWHFKSFLKLSYIHNKMTHKVSSVHLLVRHYVQSWQSCVLTWMSNNLLEKLYHSNTRMLWLNFYLWGIYWTNANGPQVVTQEESSPYPFGSGPKVVPLFLQMLASSSMNDVYICSVVVQLCLDHLWYAHNQNLDSLCVPKVQFKSQTG